MNMRTAWVATALAFVAFGASGQQPPAPGCETPEHRQFDFWVGDWKVTAEGKPAGENRIEKILKGCALLENWTGASGHQGKSLNFYDVRRGVWHQTWIDHNGMALALDGRFEDGKMTLTGQQKDLSTGVTILHRIAWSPLPSGEVRQLWDTSMTDGKAWTVQFDGLYRRKP